MTFFWVSLSLSSSFRALALGVAGFAVADKRLQFSESGFSMLAETMLVTLLTIIYDDKRWVTLL